MGGFATIDKGGGVPGTTVYADNVDFSGGHTKTVTINGQLLIGSTALPNIKVGTITSPDASITIGYSSPNITLVVAGGVTVGKTITGDSGGALSPTLGNWNIFGRSGSKTAGSVSTLTVRSPPYADAGVGASVTLNSGTFTTAAITMTTPVSAGLLDGDLLEFVATNGVMVIQLAATQVAHFGSAVTSAAGTITGSATGDSMSLRYQASTNDWWATSVVGIWTAG